MRAIEGKPVATAKVLAPLAFRTQVQSTDVEQVRRVTDATGFFSPAEVTVAVELIEVASTQGTVSGYSFLFAEQNGRPRGYACYGLVPCTAHSFDLYWIVVDANYQGQGIGGRLLARAEELICGSDGRQLYAETSSRGQYRPTRAFYRHTGFGQVARLKDFYAPGDSKIIYCKILS